MTNTMTSTSTQNIGTALVIVDVQYDFLAPSGSLAVDDSPAILPPIVELASQNDGTFDAIIASQDYHPPDHVSFASNHSEEPFTEKELPHPFTENETIRQMLWPVHCVQGTRGCEIHQDVVRVLKRQKEGGEVDVLVVRKGENAKIDGYSALSDNSYTRFTPLIRYLSSTERVNTSTASKAPIEIALVVGLALDYCVLSTAMDLLKHGIHVVLPLDCTRGVDKQGCKEALDKLRSNGANIVDTYQEALEHIAQYKRDAKPFMNVIRDTQRNFWSS